MLCLKEKDCYIAPPIYLVGQMLYNRSVRSIYDMLLAVKLSPEPQNMRKNTVDSTSMIDNH